ncbi:MAG: RNA polymerase factor sigma-32 [Deltaproteobacteria bacterium]|nr:RNA polymerase factor sigma-32 [Deltaproteobacteria bacterium]MBW2140175.1 RNA polymerase factor sigma-32 [Deltaproteobacteria bacterium]MBW2322302.1 RNA polymerase factor sigma-32 [Deltaproteobacteria bacterium]
MMERNDKEIEVIQENLNEIEPLAEESLPLMVKGQAEAPAHYDPLKRYFYEVGKHPLLSREEEIELAIRVREHRDQEAAYRLVTSNLRLVIKIALDFHRNWTKNLLDLIQEGNVGLMQAVTKFNPYRGVKFSYYASFWIKAYILKFILDNWHLVRVGTTQAQRKLFFNLKKEKEKLLAQGIVAGPKLLAEKLDVREKDIIEMTPRLDGAEISLDSSTQDESKDGLLNFIPTDESGIDDLLAKKELKELLRSIMMDFRETLKDRDLDILDNRILAENPMTLQEMGEKYEISRERVRQLEDRIKNNLRQRFIEELPEFTADDFLSAIGVED